jgi:hypothetical protein
MDTRADTFSALAKCCHISGAPKHPDGARAHAMLSQETLNDRCALFVWKPDIGDMPASIRPWRRGTSINSCMMVRK